MNDSISELFNALTASPGLGKSLESGDSSNFKVQQKLVEIATNHFVKFGYRKANIAEIAIDAGIGKGTVYLHFENKKELFLTCLITEDQKLLPQLEIVENLPKKEQLRAFLEAVFNFTLTSPLNRALLSRSQDFTALIQEIDINILEDKDKLFNEYMIKKLINPLSSNLNAQEKKTITSAINLLTLAIGYLPDMAFDMPGQQIDTDDFSKTLAILIERGIKTT
jgi:AcrR family transcriptional regulator